MLNMQNHRLTIPCQIMMAKNTRVTTKAQKQPLEDVVLLFFISLDAFIRSSLDRFNIECSDIARAKLWSATRDGDLGGRGGLECFLRVFSFELPIPAFPLWPTLSFSRLPEVGELSRESTPSWSLSLSPFSRSMKRSFPFMLFASITTTTPTKPCKSSPLCSYIFSSENEMPEVPSLFQHHT